MNTQTLFSSKTQDWQTPPEILQLVEEVAPIAFDPAPANWDRSFDGLVIPWSAFGPNGLCFVNPPYGPALPEWTRKAAREGKMFGVPIVLLIPARPDTRWWHDNILKADAVCFWKGRIKFVGAENSAPFPSAFVYFGARRERFREVFAKKGWVVLL